MARPGRTGVFALLLVVAGGSAAAQVPAESESWVFSGTLRQTFTDNLFLVGLDDAPTEAISGATLAVTYARLRQRTTFSALGWLNGSVYHRFSSYDGAMFGLGLSGQAGLERRGRLRYRASYANGLNLEALYASRVGLPQLDVKSFAASTGFTYAITPATSGNLSFDGSALRYRSELRTDSSQLPGDLLAPPDVLEPLLPGEGDTGLPAAPDGSVQVLGELAREGIRVTALDYWSGRVGAGIVHAFSPETKVNLDLDYRRSYADSGAGGVPDGQLFGATVGLARALDTTANLSLGYAFQDARYGFATRNHSLVGRATKAFGKKLRGDLSLGGSYFEGASDAASSWDVIGGAGIAVRLKRTSIALRYGRSRYQGVVVGRSLNTSDAFASLGHTFGKKVFGAVYGLYRSARDESRDLYAYDDLLGGASITVRIERRWRLGASYSYSRFDRGAALGAANRSVVSISLGYTRVMK